MVCVAGVQGEGKQGFSPRPDPCRAGHTIISKVPSVHRDKLQVSSIYSHLLPLRISVLNAINPITVVGGSATGVDLVLKQPFTAF